ncbi:hypothetical protein DSM112329_02580 [Paraconexibacter sp. AEG42_29]|uniref:Fe/B12 periplasmic-binding domain-containing protein n=1 Tax=Paraconexibacter sp. AEG42_29 TaxID=2997339 RepID=A0AAU7AVP4_9ACTN
MRLRLFLLLLIAAFAVSACGSDDDGDATTPAASTSTAAKAASAFPVTVEHQFGSTTVPKTPQRIAVVGLTEQDTVLALGFKPIATTEWYGEQPYAVWPWAQAALGDAKPTVLSNKDGFEFEKIASLRPDLIIGTNAGMKRADYEKLSAIAPTITSEKGSTEYFDRWDRQTVQVARALGKEAEGRQLVADVKAGYAKVAAEHPEFAGKTVTFSQNGFYGGLIYVYPAGLNTEFLTYLGLKVNPKIGPLAKPGEQAGISAEKLDVLEADAILFATEAPKDIRALLKVPTFKTLEAVAENRSVYTDGTLAGAIYFISPLSLPYVLERLPDQLSAALAGKAPRRIIDTSR